MSSHAAKRGAVDALVELMMLEIIHCSFTYETRRHSFS